LLWSGLGLGALIWCWFIPPFRIVPLAEARKQSAAERFDPDSFVESFWTTQLPAHFDRAVDVIELRAALEADPADAARRFGQRLGLSGTSSYFASGGGVITNLTGNAVEVLLPDDGVVVIGKGPVFGNSIRDGSGLLDVSDFPNSQDFNALSSEINRRVEERVLPALREQAAVGKAIRFIGAVDIVDSSPRVDRMKLIPVFIEFP
jgi:predicted lipoprotein